MNYSIIQPPFTLKFREMSKKELKDYNEWFHQIMPERIAVLLAAVRATAGYETWEADQSPQSLERLGEWFLQAVEIRPRTQEEIDKIEEKLKYPINVSDKELTNKTYSLAMDIGMYLSQVFSKNHPSLEWSQPFGNKKFVDYGQPVLIGFGKLIFNPVRITVTLARCFMDRSKTGERLRELYDHWSNQVAPVP